MSGGASSGASGGTTPVVFVGGDVSIEVGGFAADSSIEIWAYSTPTYLTSMTVGSDLAAGTVVTLPSSIRPGEHTIVVTGTGADGEPIELSLGILVVEEIEEPAAEPAVVADDATEATTETGGGAGAGMAIAFAILALLLATGLLFFLLARRRQRGSTDDSAAARA